jgi:NAD(P)-dependent dehydrogenase (short-subunit alcohol dehydrogenase family)
MPGRLNGKVAVISGAARGLGAAHAELFAEEGASVLIGDILVEEGEELAARLSGKGYAVSFMRLDVTSQDDWARIIAASVDRYGKLTTLINNAGIYYAAGLEDETTESWDRLISIDQTGVFCGMKTAMPHLVASGHGAIVNISSILAMSGRFRCFAYHAAKGAVRSMTSAAASEYGPKNVRVNAIFPGSIHAASHDDARPEDVALTIKATPLGRKGVPRDVAAASLYLCSDEANFVSGAELLVDGGMFAGAA